MSTHSLVLPSSAELASLLRGRFEGDCGEEIIG